MNNEERNLDSFTDQALLERFIIELQPSLDYANELKKRGYEVSGFIHENYSCNKQYKFSATAKKELKA